MIKSKTHLFLGTAILLVSCQVMAQQVVTVKTGPHLTEPKHPRILYTGECIAGEYEMQISSDEKLQLTLQGQNVDLSATKFAQLYTKRPMAGRLAIMCVRDLLHLRYRGFDITTQNSARPIQYTLIVTANGMIHQDDGLEEVSWHALRDAFPSEKVSPPTEPRT